MFEAIALIFITVLGFILGLMFTTSLLLAFFFLLFFVPAVLAGIATFIHWMVDPFNKEERMPAALTTIACACLCVAMVLI